MRRRSARCARSRGAVVRGRLPRHRHRATRPARPRLRPLHGGHAQVALRRTGHGVPLREPGPAPDAGAGRHGVVRDARAVLVRQPAPRLPPNRAAAGARHAAGAGVLHRARWPRHHQRGHARADPGTPGRADRPRHRPRGRSGAPGAHAARSLDPRRRGQRRGRTRSRRHLSRAAANATSAPTTAAKACASARTSSTTRPTSTSVSRSSATWSSPAWARSKEALVGRSGT